MRVAIQGEKGSFSHEAALRMATQQGMPTPEIVTCALSPEVFAAVVSGNADAAVIPIENSLAGSVLEHYDLLLAQAVRIEAELLLPIHHQLIAAPGTALEDIEEVYSHPVALAQVRNFLAARPGLRAVPFYDTAGAVAHAIQSGGAIAAVGSAHAARTYGGTVLAAGIEDHEENYTRFLLLRRQADTGNSLPVANPVIPGANKVCIAFAVPNEPGSLVRALTVFAAEGLNLTRLESRPVPGSPWQYVFYADYQLTDIDHANRLLPELAATCTFVKELGRFVAATS